MNVFGGFYSRTADVLFLFAAYGTDYRRTQIVEAMELAFSGSHARVEMIQP